MAKSIRSKRMKKLRAIKRARNGPRETKRLKKILGLLKPEEEDVIKKVYKFEDLRELITKPGVNQASGTKYDLRYVPDRDKIKGTGEAAEDAMVDENNENEEENKLDAEQLESMETDGEDKKKGKGLKNEHGNYPIWMSHRKIKKIKRKGRLNKHKLKRAGSGKTF
ncbi:protein LLP homolog [Asterias rubens]|uniref:protein LLP homolog n=1 Tax=Asterias rubens TaxID=7604 RepID=UPI00145592EF|nr:protein LLP homolog [Asterias rubens]XP_033646763.1 protein LLP homolog [Asterias rubens]